MQWEVISAARVWICGLLRQFLRCYEASMANVVIKRLQLNNLQPVKEQWPGVHEDLQKTQTRVNDLTTVLEELARLAGVDIKKLLGGS